MEKSMQIVVLWLYLKAGKSMGLAVSGRSLSELQAVSDRLHVAFYNTDC